MTKKKKSNALLKFSLIYLWEYINFIPPVFIHR